MDSQSGISWQPGLQLWHEALYSTASALGHSATLAPEERGMVQILNAYQGPVTSHSSSLGRETWQGAC